MEYTLGRDESVPAGIKRIIDGKVATGIEHIDSDMDRHETVHEVRKRCKEVRAALRLVRTVLPTYSEENAHYRDAARRISDIRDAQALIETFDEHVTETAAGADALDAGTLSGAREELVERRETVAANQDLDGRLASVREDLVAGRQRIDDLPVATDGFDAVAGGLRKSYKRARNRMRGLRGPRRRTVSRVAQTGQVSPVPHAITPDRVGRADESQTSRTEDALRPHR
jgi:hypothetical protein